MARKSQDERRDEILDVAVETLAENGYRDASMLAVAKRASASKETLYAWFGSKGGMFEAAIRRNASSVQSVMAHHFDGNAPIVQVLSEFGAVLLTLLLSDSAVAINRAAISEARSDPALAETLAGAGRDATVPDLLKFLEKRQTSGDIRFDDASEAANDFLGLLIGETQIRRLLDLTAAPKTAEIRSRAAHATQAFLKIYGAD